MNLEQVEIVKIYLCSLSGKKMLITQTQKSVQTPNGANDENGNPTFDMTTTEVKAGKYAEELNGVLTFKFDEVFDGQLEEINS